MIRFNLKNLLEENQITQVEMARKTGIRQPTISAICNNAIKELPVNVLEKICDFFCCGVGDFIENIPVDNIDKRREISGMEYSVPFTTKEERIKMVKNALAISTLDAQEPTRATRQLLDEFIEGHITEEEMLRKTLERYQMQED